MPTIHGHTIEGDPTALHYLANLDYGEIETLVNQAKYGGKAKFKYDYKHYEIAYTSSGTYVVTRVETDSGLF